MELHKYLKFGTLVLFDRQKIFQNNFDNTTASPPPVMQPVTLPCLLEAESADETVWLPDIIPTNVAI